MIILSHRGYWKTANEKNSTVAFKRSFNNGFGTETDVRDACGTLLISHDPPTGKEITFDSFLSLANEFHTNERLTLAINVKADGLASAIDIAIKNFKNLDIFVFDMAVPDMRDYFAKGIPVFARMSEEEQQGAWLDRCAGVWLDNFESEWFSNSLIIDLLLMQKRVCIVSPELHRREHKEFWERIKPLSKEPMLMLCTDYPEAARDFFQIP